MSAVAVSFSVCHLFFELLQVVVIDVFEPWCERAEVLLVLGLGAEEKEDEKDEEE